MKDYANKLFPLCSILKEAQPLKTPVEFSAEALYLKFLVAIKWALVLIFFPEENIKVLSQNYISWLIFSSLLKLY